MRTNIEIDNDTLDAAMRAGPYKTKKDAVEAGLKLLARRAAYHEILKWEGKLDWDGDDVPAAPLQRADATAFAPAQAPRKLVLNEPTAKYTAVKPRHGRR